MGSPDSEQGRNSNEGPQHSVTIKTAFAIGQYQVTFDEYDAFCTATNRNKPGDQGWGRGNRPVIHVSWEDAVAYCEWLFQQTGRTYRLPSEAEWEYACRAGTTTAYSFGDDISQLGAYAWFYDNSNQQTHPVGEKQPNAWGLYDMHGNVWEWCQDRWHGSYQGAPGDGSAWETGSEKNRLLRGGSWASGNGNCRVAYRNCAHDPGSSYGFRVVCAV
jgi:formylglycine-generating enzyme required for sulfatase activity